MGVYGPAIVGLNLVVLLASIILLYFANVLISFYLLPTLDFVEDAFSTVPNLALAVGLLGIIISLIGMAAGAVSSRPGLILHAVLTSALVLIQLASVYNTNSLRNQLDLKDLSRRQVNKTGLLNDPNFRLRWDVVQETYSCCGIQNLITGFRDWDLVLLPGVREHEIGQTVPDSCCVQYSKRCGYDVLAGETHEIHREINVHGCLPILEDRFERNLKPLLLAHLGTGVVLALILIIAIVLSSAYAAAITRRKQREADRMNDMTQGDKRSIYHFTDRSQQQQQGTGSRSASRTLYEEADRLSSASSTAKPDFRSSAYIERSSTHDTEI